MYGGRPAASVSAENETIKTAGAASPAAPQQIIDHLHQAVQNGELQDTTDAESLGDYFAVFLHGLSVQARDGVPESRLQAAVKQALNVLPPS